MGGASVLPPLLSAGLSVCMIERGPAWRPPAGPGEALPYLPPEPSNLGPDGCTPFILEGATVGGTTALFSANLATGDLTDAIGLPIAADTALNTLAAGFEYDIISSGLSQITADFSGLF